MNSFNAFELDYMFTGALTVSYYGTPRTTVDIDIIVNVVRKDLQNRLVPALRGAGLQVDENRIRAALGSAYRLETFKNSKTPFSVDIMFSSKKLRKKAGSILGLPTFYQLPEDLILAKLRMIRATVPKERALKDVDDVRAILRFTEVDLDDIRRRARRNSMSSLFEIILQT